MQTSSHAVWVSGARLCELSISGNDPFGSAAIKRPCTYAMLGPIMVSLVEKSIRICPCLGGHAQGYFV